MMEMLDVDVDLDCLVDNHIPVKISGAGTVLQVRLDSLKDLLTLSKRHALRHNSRIQLVHNAHGIIRQTGLSASLTVAGRSIAELSPAYSGGMFNRLVGLGPLKLRPLAILLTLLSNK